MIKTITVRLIDLDWFMKHDMKFLKLTQILNEAENQSIFVTEFVMNVLNEFWDENYYKLLYKQLLPFIGCLLATIFYLEYALIKDETLEQSEEKLVTRAIFGLITLAFLSHQVYNEVVQYCGSAGFFDHFNTIWNFNDLFWQTTCPFIVLVSIPSQRLIETEVLITLSSFATFGIMIKGLDWMRLFDKTSFYILLIMQTINDISAFILLIVMSLMMFGIPMNMLNLNRDEDNKVVDDPFSYWLPNIMINQWLLALGEFNIDSFEMGTQASMCFIFFVLATFFSSVTMLNMLIAIMGDTFERITENRDLNKTRTKLGLMGELSSTIYDSEKDNERFMFCITPDEQDEDELGEWEGSIKQMSKLMDKRITVLELKLNKSLLELKDGAEMSSQRDIAQDRDLKQSVFKLI